MTGSLDLPAAGVETAPSGHIVVDAASRTSSEAELQCSIEAQQRRGERVPSSRLGRLRARRRHRPNRPHADRPRSGTRTLDSQLALAVLRVQTYSAAFSAVFVVSYPPVLTRCSEDSARDRPPAPRLAYSARRPTAIAAGRLLSDRLFGGASEADTLMDYDFVPTVVFSHPPLAVCGLTEARSSRDLAEIWPRSGRDLAEI